MARSIGLTYTSEWIPVLRAEIVDGLADNDQVIVQPDPSIAEGTPVQVDPSLVLGQARPDRKMRRIILATIAGEWNSVEGGPLPNK